MPLKKMKSLKAFGIVGCEMMCKNKKKKHKQTLKKKTLKTLCASEKNEATESIWHCGTWNDMQR